MARHLLLIMILMLAPPLKAVHVSTPQLSGAGVSTQVHGSWMFSRMNEHDQCKAPDCQTQCQIQSQWPALVPLTVATGSDRSVPPGTRRTDSYQPPYLEHPLRPPLFHA